ncbi:MAG: hypothetical protein CSA76_02420 [Spirochaetales bacterium]|nr:MAG: hypothetical protein CSA76_02420 [Spirochaetales bacterium]
MEGLSPRSSIKPEIHSAKQNRELLAHLPLPEEDRCELLHFCAPEADRFSVLKQSLIRRKIPFNVIPLEGARHILLPAPPPSALNKNYYRVTLVAHYDRVDNTPGANDNAASVFQLLAHREAMYKEVNAPLTQIIFTDKEELLAQHNTASKAPLRQGSWYLARHLRRLGVSNVLFFVLDMCGIGDTPVWGHSVRKAGIHTLQGIENNAFTEMETFLKKFSGGKNFGVHPLFSDDLGLLLGGYPALQVSLLPRHQAEQLPPLPANPLPLRQHLQNNMPPAWQSAHTPFDTPDKLQAASFLLISRLLRGLSLYRFPLGPS